MFIRNDSVVGISEDKLSPAQRELVSRSDNSASRVYVRGPSVRTGRSLEKYGCRVRAIRGEDGHEFLNARQWAPIKARLDAEKEAYRIHVASGGDFTNFVYEEKIGGGLD
jgi:hypothetical protein|tara:strand:- start:1691 stop:2020 length:330 start_codon:yes stop_codon:yes gene_type:complete